MNSGTVSKNADRATRFKHAQKIGVISLMQESNSFSPRKTSIDNFDIATTNELALRKPSANLEFEGALNEISALDGTAVAVFNAFALPSGPIDKESLKTLIDLLERKLKTQQAIDAYVCCLHGAMIDESGNSADLHILRFIRKFVGDSIPIALSLDLHANISEEFLELATVISGYKTNPHIDMSETGRRVVRLLLKTTAGEIKPTMSLAKCPTIFPDQTLNTSEGIFAEILTRHLEKIDDSIIDVSVFPCQPWLDSKGIGFGALCISNNDPTAARELSSEIVNAVWRHREDFKISNLASPSQAINIAENSSIRPFIIAESSDAPTAGASGDSPIMIEAFISSNSGLNTFIPITDQPAVAKCHALTLGDEPTLSLGCTIDQRWSKPVSIKVRLDYLGDGDYELTGAGYSGLKATMGRFAVVSFRSMKILISEFPCWSADPATWRHAQLDAFDSELLVVRSCSDFKANFPDSGNSALYLDVLGAASNQFSKLPYKNCAQGTWPIDKTIV